MNIFYKNDITSGSNDLSEEESRHCAMVLRHKVGDEVVIFDGLGNSYQSILTYVSKNRCSFDITEIITAKKKGFSVHLGIAPTKSVDRMEWMIEKLAEIGVDRLTFLETRRSERRKLRFDRFEKKAISAMKQSGNPFLLKVNDLTTFESFATSSTTEVKVIAHVDNQLEHMSDLVKPNKPTTILIGPEGDFHVSELQLAEANGFTRVSLGTNTLRTETAGFVACCTVNLINKY